MDLFSFVGVFLEFSSIFISSKILRADKKINTKLMLLLVIFSTLSGIMYQFIGISTSLFMLVAGIFMVYIESNSLQKSLFSYMLALVTLCLCNNAVNLIATLIFNRELALTESEILMGSFFSYALGILLSFLEMLILKKLRLSKIYDEKFEKSLVFFLVFMWLTYQANNFIGRHLENNATTLRLNFMFMLIYFIISIVVFFFYFESVQKKSEAEKVQAEFETMQRYTKEIEQQYMELRKFRHDYQNILTSMESYIREKDYIGLEKYYFEKIQKSSANFDLANFQLENLRNIYNKEVKSILASKLMHAQSLGIETTFEAKHLVENIPMEPVFLVRALGIILDNSIEKLVELNYGKLQVAVIKNEKDIMLIVENTCNKDIPRIHQLKQQGFSTKGPDRGLGLTTLSEMIGSCPNAVLETLILGDKFIQKIIVMNKE